jgi:hypothetical protein
MYIRELLRKGQQKISRASGITTGVGKVADFILSAKEMVDLVLQSVPQAAPGNWQWSLRDTPFMGRRPSPLRPWILAVDRVVWPQEVLDGRGCAPASPIQQPIPHVMRMFPPKQVCDNPLGSSDPRFPALKSHACRRAIT